MRTTRGPPHRLSTIRGMAARRRIEVVRRMKVQVVDLCLGETEVRYPGTHGYGSQLEVSITG